MISREFWERHEREWLASYAVKSGESKGRRYPEKEHGLRSAFQRDRDRIVHSTAFRRLEYKTQVFVNHEGDHYRTRLTHTLEMAQIAKTIARALQLNEDLTETIALGHDLGHGPFGHAGEWALHDLMRPHGGFEHNLHCLRIVEELEESYANFPGLNLTFEVREGLRKHVKKRFRSLEADVVDYADEIAYNCHDLDDGIRAGFLDEELLRQASLWMEAKRYVERKASRAAPAVKTRMAVRLLINRLVGNLLEETERNLNRYHFRKPTDLSRTDAQVVAFSKPVARQVKELKQFLLDHLYHHHRVVRMTEKGQRFIKELFHSYEQKPEQLPPQTLKRVKKGGLQRAICDYIAGMTDRFALDEYNRFFSPYERV